MRNKIIFTIFVLALTAVVPSTLLAQVKVSTSSSTLSPSVTSTASPSAVVKPTATPEDKQVEDFKESIATKVAELRKKGQKAVAGTITSTGSGQVVIKNSLDVTYNVKLDDTLTKIYQITGGIKKELKQSDLEKGMYIIVSGPLLDKTLNANVVYIDEQIFVKSGKIVEVDTTDGMLKVITSEKDNLTLDLNPRLKIMLMDSKTLELGATTTSKIKEGDTVHFVYTKTGDEKLANTFVPSKVVIIPQEYFQQKTEK